VTYTTVLDNSFSLCDLLAQPPALSHFLDHCALLALQSQLYLSLLLGLAVFFLRLLPRFRLQLPQGHYLLVGFLLAVLELSFRLLTFWRPTLLLASSRFGYGLESFFCWLYLFL
jgi:hypothetical protein